MARNGAQLADPQEPTADVESAAGITLAEEVDAGTLATLSKAEISQQIATAHQFPRSVQRFRQQALSMVTMNESIARECVYALPRDGKVIEGPSVRFAEILASCWGNCREGARVIDESGHFIVAQGIFHDLQTNNAISFEVRRRIIDKRGRRYNADMIGVTANAASSIALRNAILRGVPRALWGDIYEAARKTIMGDFKTLKNRRAEALAAFQPYGVSPEQIFRKLEVKGPDDIDIEKLVVLSGMLTAIKDGESSPEEMFAEDSGASPAPATAGSRPAPTAATAANGEAKPAPASEPASAATDGSVPRPETAAPAASPAAAPAAAKAAAPGEVADLF